MNDAFLMLVSFNVLAIIMTAALLFVADWMQEEEKR